MATEVATPTESPPQTANGEGQRRQRRREYLLFLAFVAPNLVLLAVFSY